jgi:hypothetical protein
MSGDKSNTRAQHRARINVDEPYELSYWSKELGVSEEKLREFARRHGVSAETIRAVLGK